MPQFQGRMRIGYDTGEHIDIDVSSCDEETSGEDDGVQPTVGSDGGQGGGRGSGRGGGRGGRRGGGRGAGEAGRQPQSHTLGADILPGSYQPGTAQLAIPRFAYAGPSQLPPPPQVVPQAGPAYRPPAAHPSAAAQAAHAPAAVPWAARSAVHADEGLYPANFAPQDMRRTTTFHDVLRPPAVPTHAAQSQVAVAQTERRPRSFQDAGTFNVYAGQAAPLGLHRQAAGSSGGWGTTMPVAPRPVAPQVCPPPDGWPAAPTGGWTGQHNPAAAFLSGPTISEALAMLRSANETILDLSQQLTVANQKLAYYEAEEATKKKGGSRTKRIAGNEDDPDQPAELSGKKLKLRSTIRAFALMHSPWPNLRPLEYTYTPNFDPLDPFERYANATTNEPRIEAQVVELRNFFPEEYLPFTTTAWMQRQFTEVINAYKSHIVSAVKDNAHIIFRHIPHLERDLDYWRGVAGDRYPAIFFPRDQKGNEEYLFQEASVAKACRIMTHGRTAGNADHRIRGNTNSSKWKLQSVTTAMLAIGLVLVRYLLSDFSSFERKNWQEAFYEYHRKILESMHKRSMQRLFAWLDLYVFGPGSDVPLAQTQEPNPIDDILLPGERNARLAPPAAPHLPQQADAHAHDHYLHQADRHDHPYNYSDNHGPLPLVPLHAHDNHADHPTGHEDVLHDNDDHTRGNGGVRNVHDDAHGACNTGGPRHIHQNEDIRDGWHLVGDGNNSGGNDGVYNSDGVNDNPRHDSRHADLHPPAHHELSYEDLRSSPPVSVGHDRGNVPISRHVHLPPGIGEHELPGDHVNAGAASAFASSSSHGASSGDTRTMLGGSVDEQAGKADPVVHLTTATADLALVQPKKTPRPRRKKTTATDSEQVPAQPSNPNLRLRSRKHA